ncbi:MAG: phosphodiesterase [Firmicutes bacterium]|nr:phosphodiesterase [Bacillota bacterium]
MKLMIASDIHGSAVRCAEMLERFEAERADRLLLLGDLLYHGARNDLPEGYDAWKAAALLNAYASKIIAVRGNCDSEETQTMLEFPCTADYTYIPFAGGTVFAAHGDVWGPDRLPPSGSFDLLLFGHIHVPVFEQIGDHVFIANPGSVAIPKAGSRMSYMTLEEDGKLVWKTLDGNTYREGVLI